MSLESATTDPTADPPTTSWSGVAVSFAFWLTLLLSAVIFASVSLAPKLAHHLALENEYRSQQFELKRIEQQQTELERVIAALKDDPHFSAELARLEFDAVRPGEEILNVDTSLALHPNRPVAAAVSHVSSPSPWQPWVEIFANNSQLRFALLATAAGLILFAFGWLQDRCPTGHSNFPGHC